MASLVGTMPKPTPRQRHNCRPIPSSPLVGSDTSTAKLPAWLVLYRGYVVHSVNRQLEHRVTNICYITGLNQFSGFLYVSATHFTLNFRDGHIGMASMAANAVA